MAKKYKETKTTKESIVQKQKINENETYVKTSTTSRTEKPNKGFPFGYFANIDTFVFLFLIIIFGSTLTFFINNKTRYLPSNNGVNDMPYQTFTGDEALIKYMQVRNVLTIETPIAELNGHTLREVFEDGNELTSPYEDYTYGNNTQYYISVFVQSVWFRENHTYYERATFEAKNPTPLGDTQKIFFMHVLGGNNRVTGSKTIDGIELYKGDISTIWTNTFTTGDIYTAKKNYVSVQPNSIKYDIDDYLKTTNNYFIDMTNLGILASTDMDYYYSLYQVCKDNNGIYIDDSNVALLGLEDVITNYDSETFEYHDYYFLDNDDFVDLGQNSLRGFANLLDTFNFFEDVLTDVTYYWNKIMGISINDNELYLNDEFVVVKGTTFLDPVYYYAHYLDEQSISRYLVYHESEIGTYGRIEEGWYLIHAGYYNSMKELCTEEYMITADLAYSIYYQYIKGD